MAINNPSQYDCDKMKPGDIVYITKRNFLYKLYRKYFMKDKIKCLVTTYEAGVEYKFTGDKSDILRLI